MREPETSREPLALGFHERLLERVPAVVYTSEAGIDGEWRYISPEIELLLGYSAEEWCADRTLWASRLHPDDREQVCLEEEAATERVVGLTAAEYRLLHRDGTPVWVRDSGRQFTEPDGALVWHGVMVPIGERKEAEIELARRAAQQSAVATLGEHALEGTSTEALMEEATRVAAQRLDVDVSGLLEYVAEDECFILRAQYGGSDESLGQVSEPAAPDTVPGYAMQARTPVIVPDWAHETRFRSGQRPSGLGLRATVAVLIEGGHGTYGVLGAHSREARNFRADEVDFLQSLANVLADALERQAIDAEIRHRALHDPLTGLPNRTLFLDRLEHSLSGLRRRGGLASVLFLDFDHFKLINDSLGHAVGDELLVSIATRIRQAVRGGDTVARFGGDEFGVLIEGIGSETEAIEMAERLAALFARPLLVAGVEHFITASIGIAIARGSERAHDLIRDADAAMYRAKDRGRARYEIFDDAMRGRALERLRLELHLRRAIEREEWTVVYQPVVSLPQRALVGVEALVRWNHPQRGLVSPADFIPVAEETGLISAIGRWVLEAACRQCAEWHAEFPGQAPLNISVNLSPAQLGRPGLVDMVDRTLQSSGLEPGALCLELTETAMMREPEAAAETLAGLTSLGVKLALDDFGTGFSSLALLPRLPLDAVKIDRSFVDGLGDEPEDTAITEAILAISHSLSLWTVAEGVETVRQIGELVRLGCPLAQGYYFSPPVSAADISEMLAGEPEGSDEPRFPLPV